MRALLLSLLLSPAALAQMNKNGKKPPENTSNKAQPMSNPYPLCIGTPVKTYCPPGRRSIAEVSGPDAAQENGQLGPGVGLRRRSTNGPLVNDPFGTGPPAGFDPRNQFGPFSTSQKNSIKKQKGMKHKKTMSREVDNTIEESSEEQDIEPSGPGVGLRRRSMNGALEPRQYGGGGFVDFGPDGPLSTSKKGGAKKMGGPKPKKPIFREVESSVEEGGEELGGVLRRRFEPRPPPGTDPLYAYVPGNTNPYDPTTVSQKGSTKKMGHQKSKRTISREVESSIAEGGEEQDVFPGIQRRRVGDADNAQ